MHEGVPQSASEALKVYLDCGCYARGDATGVLRGNSNRSRTEGSACRASQSFKSTLFPYGQIYSSRLRVPSHSSARVAFSCSSSIGFECSKKEMHSPDARFSQSSKASGECILGVPSFPGRGQNVMFARSSITRALLLLLVATFVKFSKPACPKLLPCTFVLPK